jgi:hypothetical protein
MKKFFLFSSLLLLFFQCRDDGLARYIDFYNNSGKPVCYYMPWKYGTFYPDTILPEKNPEPYKFNKEWHFNFGNPGMNENQLFATFPTDTLSVFFFDPDTLAKYEWETIRKEYKVLVRYDFSHADLKRLEWRIYYPPTEAMKDIKMYPPYKEE